MHSTRLTLLAALIGCASCGHAHLDEQFAQSYRPAFGRQVVRSGPPATAVTGLDSQEAAITSENYRASLVAKGAPAKEEPMLLVTPESRDRMAPLKPSVPPRE